MSASVLEWRRDGQRQSHVGFFRRLERKLRRATSLAFPSEGDADVVESKPARARRRRVSSRPDKFLVQETDHRDEHCQRMSAVRVARRSRRVVKWLRQGRSVFFEGHCGLFRSNLNALSRNRMSVGNMFCNSAFSRYLVPLFLLYVRVVGVGDLLLVGRSSRVSD